MDTFTFVLGLHNTSTVSNFLTLSCVYQAMQTWKIKFSIAFCFLNQALNPHLVETTTTKPLPPSLFLRLVA